MMDYGKGAYMRTRGNLPPLETVNMFVEETPGSGVVMQSRRPLKQVAEIGGGPIQASSQSSGVFAGDLFTLSGGVAYRGIIPLGPVAVIGPASIAVRDGEVLFNAGGPIYSYNGTDFVEVSFPDNSNVTQVLFTNGYFIALEAATGYWFFSAIDNGRLWDALDFANVESNPDALLWAVVLDGIVVFAGARSVEFWSPTGNADLPFTPIQQRVFEQGLIASGCMVQDDNTFFWIGADKIPYRNGDVPQAFGGDFLVERIEASVTWRMYLLKDQRHKFVCLRLDSETWAYDITTGEIFELRSYGRDNFRCGQDFGDDETGKIWAWGEFGVDDEGPIERILTAGERLAGAKIFDNVTIEAEVGTTPFLTGDYIDPVIEFRMSDDGGNTWTDWESDTLGEQGDYRKIVEYNALGMFNAPGALFQIRVTAPVSFRVTGFLDNVNTKGRS
jgi:hypothetical protein